MKYIRDKMNKRAFLFIAFNIIVVIYLINTFPNINNFLRKLEDDPRTKGVNEICMEIVNNDLYDLKDLDQKVYNITDNIILSFCKNIEGYKSSCIYKDNTVIKKLAGDIHGEENNNNKIEANNNIVKLYLSAGDNFNSNEKYKVNIELICDQNINDFTLLEKPNFDINTNNILTIKGKCKQACVLANYYGEEIGITWRIIIGIALLVGGVYIGIFGYRGRKIGIFLVCIAGFVFLSTIILQLFNETDLVINIIVMFIFALAGIGLSIFFIYKQKFLKIYMILVGGITGYVISSTANNLFISLIDTEHQKLIRIIVIVVFIVIGVIFGIFLTKGTFIVGTSIIGSYCLMRAMSFFLYTVVPFVDELKIYDLATHGNYAKIVEMIWGLFLIYPSMFVVFIVATIIIQIKINPKWRDVEDYKLLEKDFDKPVDLPQFRISDEDDNEEENKDDKDNKDDNKDKKENNNE